MLSVLGLSTVAELVYRQLLSHPDWGVAEFVSHLGLSELDVRDAMDCLFDLALLLASDETPNALQVVDPEIGLQAAMARQQADLARRQQEVAESNVALNQLIEDFRQARRNTPTLTELVGLAAVHDKLAQLTQEIQSEVLTFMPGGARSPAALSEARRNDSKLLERRIRIKTVGLDSIRNDPATMAHARYLSDSGAEFRTSPVLPPRMIVVDQRAALVPLDPGDSGKGALYLTGPGLVAAMVALFDQVWTIATPLGTSRDPDRHGLSGQERALLRLLSQGLTDEAAATRLGISHRTARRMMTDMMERLNARSRFEAGLRAAQRGWL